MLALLAPCQTDNRSAAASVHNFIHINTSAHLQRLLERASEGDHQRFAPFRLVRAAPRPPIDGVAEIAFSLT